MPQRQKQSRKKENRRNWQEEGDGLGGDDHDSSSGGNGDVEGTMVRADSEVTTTADFDKTTLKGQIRDIQS